jgi:hypothetical protein
MLIEGNDGLDAFVEVVEAVPDFDTLFSFSL